MNMREQPKDRPSLVSKKPIVKVDNFVRKHTKAVDLEILNQQGFTKVNYLTFSKINDLIARAVLRALEKYEKTWSEQQAQKIQEEAKAEVRQQLPLMEESPEPTHLFRKKQVLKEDVESIKPLVESRINELEDEKKLGVESEILAFTEKSFAQLERQMSAALSRFLKEEGEAYFSGAGVSPQNGLRHLREDLKRAVNDTLLGERHRLLDFLAQASFQKTDLLQRRLKKLKGHLAEMEEALKKLSEASEIDEGLPSIYREIQGLSLEDTQFEKKRGMLKLIFEENMQLQKAAHDEI